jgi:tetratricopeptide (TPR) repeat protein
LATCPDANLRDAGRAVELDRKAVELEPKQAFYWQTLGFAEYRAGNWESAIAALEKVKALGSPGDSLEWFPLAMAHWQLGHKEEARKHYEHAILWFHTNDPYSAELLRLCTETEELLGIFAAYKQAIRDTPGSAEAHHRLGRFLLRSKGETDAAISHLREAIRLDPSLIEAHFNLGVAMQGKGVWREAAESFQKVVQLQPSYRNARDAVEYSLNTGAWELATNPDPALRDGKLAVELAKKAVNLKKSNGIYWQTLAWAQYRAGDWKEAVAAMEKVKQLGSAGDSIEWFLLAMAHWQLGKKVEARKWYDQAVTWMDKNAPKNEELRRFRAEAEELMKIEPKKD